MGETDWGKLGLVLMGSAILSLKVEGTKKQNMCWPGVGGRSHLCCRHYQCLSVRSWGNFAASICHFSPSGDRTATTVLFWSTLCSAQVHLIPRMALCAPWARMQTHISQHPNAFVTFPECLLPHKFCLGNALPTLLAPSAQGFVQIANIFLGNLQFSPNVW